MTILLAQHTSIISFIQYTHSRTIHCTTHIHSRSSPLNSILHTGGPFPLHNILHYQDDHFHITTYYMHRRTSLYNIHTQEDHSPYITYILRRNSSHIQNTYIGGSFSLHIVQHNAQEDKFPSTKYIHRRIIRHSSCITYIHRRNCSHVQTTCTGGSLFIHFVQYTYTGEPLVPGG